MNLVDKFHFVPVLYPAADAFAGGTQTDVVECLGDGVLFNIILGDATAGTARQTYTVDACSNAAAAATTAVAFMYRASTTPDTWGAWTQATATGFLTTAGDNQMYQIYVPAAELASEGYGYVRLAIAETVNDPVLAAITAAVVRTTYAPQPESLLD